MGLESASNINELNENWPLGTDPKSQGDDHLRLIKDVLKTVFADGAEGEGLVFDANGILQKQAVGAVGSIMAWPTAIAPTGFLECDGAALSRTTYAALFAVIGTSYGAGDGSTTFNIPDFRGEFLRGWDNTAGNDPDAASRTDRGDGTTGDNIGTRQLDQYKNHAHSYIRPGSTTRSTGNAGCGTQGTGNVTGAAGGSETRGRNVYVMYCIKY